MAAPSTGAGPSTPHGPTAKKRKLNTTVNGRTSPPPSDIEDDSDIDYEAAALLRIWEDVEKLRQQDQQTYVSWMEMFRDMRDERNRQLQEISRKVTKSLADHKQRKESEKERKVVMRLAGVREDTVQSSHTMRIVEEDEEMVEETQDVVMEDMITVTKAPSVATPSIVTPSLVRNRSPNYFFTPAKVKGKGKGKEKGKEREKGKGKARESEKETETETEKEKNGDKPAWGKARRTIPPQLSKPTRTGPNPGPVRQPLLAEVPNITDIDDDTTSDESEDEDSIDQANRIAIEEAEAMDQPISARRAKRQSAGNKHYNYGSLEELGVKNAKDDDDADATYQGNTQDSTQGNTSTQSSTRLRQNLAAAATKSQSGTPSTKRKGRDGASLSETGTPDASGRYSSNYKSSDIVASLNTQFNSKQMALRSNIPGEKDGHLFGRMEIRKAIGGHDKRTNVTAKADDTYLIKARKVVGMSVPDTYVCVRGDLQSDFVERPGSNGVYFELKDELVTPGETRTFFKSVGESKWEYMGEYTCLESHDLSRREWQSLPLSVQRHWADLTMKTAWGKSLLRERGFPEDDDFKSAVTVCNFFGAPDNQPHIRLKRRVLKFEGYNRDLYDYIRVVSNDAKEA